MVIEALYLFDINEQFIDLIPGEELQEHDQTQELKKLITISASALYSEMLESAVFVGHRDIDDSNVFHQYRVTKFKNNNGIAEIEGVHAFFDDMQAYGFIKDKRPTDATVSTALGGILEGSRWQLGVIQSAHSSTSNYYYVSRLEAFWDFIEKWNVEFKLRMVYSDGVIIGRYVDIYDQLSADYGKWYEYGDQLLTVEKEEDRQGVYTALIGRGKGEETEAGGFGRRILFSDVEWTISGGDPVDKPLLQDYVELPSATAQYGYSDGTPRIGIVEFEDITDPTLLLEATYQTLLANCRPQVQFKAGVDEKGLSELGEIVSIIRDDLNIRYKTRVYKLRRNFLDQMDKEFTFGDKLTTSQGEKNVQIGKDIKKQEQQTISWLEVVNAAMMSMFWNEDGYNYTFAADNEYGLPGGFYSFNAPIDMDPTKCIYMGAGMLAIANSKLPDGSWNFRTWGTGDGFTADLITTGTLRADIVQAGFNGIAQGVSMTADGLKAVAPSGEYSIVENGGVSFFTKNDIKTGSIESGYLISDETNGVSVFVEPGRFFSVNRKNELGVNERFIHIPHDKNEIRLQKPVSVTRLNIAGTNQYITNMSNQGGVFFDTVRVSLGTGTLDAVSKVISAEPGKAIIHTPSFFNGPITTKSSSSTIGGKIFDNNDVLLIGGADGTNIGYTNGIGITSVARFTQGNIIAYTTLNMNGNVITNQSDIRLKDKVVDAVVDPFSVIEKMRFINFEWDATNPYNEKKPTGEQFGIEAQYSPFLAVKDQVSNYLSIDMGKQVNINSMALQRMITEIKTLKEESAATKKELADLKQLLIEKGVI